MKLTFAFFLFFISLASFGQIVFVDSSLTWEQLSKRATDEKKLIFIHFENSKCEQCNEVASDGFKNTILKEKFAQNFVSIRVNVASQNGRKLLEKLDIKGELLSVFADPAGNILQRHSGSTNSGMVYAEQADLALNRKGKKQLSEYIREYQAGERSSAFMRSYMLMRRESAMPVEDLLDEYTSLLPVDSLLNLETIKFIYQQGPALNSKTYSRFRVTTPWRLIDSLYRSIPLEEAIAINQSIIGNSFRNAVRDRNNMLAQQTAIFNQNTYTNDRAGGLLAYQGTLTRYYLAIKDTVNYLLHAKELIERNHLRVTADSLKKLDALAFKRTQASQQKNQTRVVKIAPPSQYLHIELNEHAWHFYEMATKKEDLETGLSWSKRSIELFDELKGTHSSLTLGNPNYLDTYAHILYKMGRKEEAFEWQTRAVEAQKITGNAYASFENTLNKMKEGNL
jgi:tetratricopeptide (TPR) repeat protein